MSTSDIQSYIVKPVDRYMATNGYKHEVKAVRTGREIKSAAMRRVLDTGALESAASQRPT